MFLFRKNNAPKTKTSPSQFKKMTYEQLSDFAMQSEANCQQVGSYYNQKIRQNIPPLIEKKSWQECLDAVKLAAIVNDVETLILALNCHPELYSAPLIEIQLADAYHQLPVLHFLAYLGSPLTAMDFRLKHKEQFKEALGAPAHWDNKQGQQGSLGLTPFLIAILRDDYPNAKRIYDAILNQQNHLFPEDSDEFALPINPFVWALAQENQDLLHIMLEQSFYRGGNYTRRLAIAAFEGALAQAREGNIEPLNKFLDVPSFNVETIIQSSPAIGGLIGQGPVDLLLKILERSKLRLDYYQIDERPVLMHAIDKVITAADKEQAFEILRALICSGLEVEDKQHEDRDPMRFIGKFKCQASHFSAQGKAFRATQKEVKTYLKVAECFAKVTAAIVGHKTNIGKELLKAAKLNKAFLNQMVHACLQPHCINHLEGMNKLNYGDLLERLIGFTLTDGNACFDLETRHALATTAKQFVQLNREYTSANFRPGLFKMASQLEEQLADEEQHLSANLSH